MALKPYTWTHKLRITSVSDGDTLRADVDLGHQSVLENQKIRLLGSDTPETKGKDKELGLAVSAVVKKLVPKLCKQYNDVVWFRSTAKKDSFGRMIGEVYFGDESISLNKILLDWGLAKIWVGGLFRIGVDYDKKYILDQIALLQPYLNDTTGEVKPPKISLPDLVKTAVVVESFPSVVVSTPSTGNVIASTVTTKVVPAVVTKPKVTKPVVTKPVTPKVTKPVVTKVVKPAVTKPVKPVVAKVKPIVTKPVKPIVAKVVKPVVTKPVVAKVKPVGAIAKTTVTDPNVITADKK